MADSCQKDDAYDGSIGLRIGAVFIILVTSAFATLFPVVTKRIPRLNIPMWAYDIARYFGSGVILATAFMHLLQPASEELGSECLNDTFQGYPFAFFFCLFSSLCVLCSCPAYEPALPVSLRSSPLRFVCLRAQLLAS